MRYPSYLSLEYVLGLYNLIPEAAYTVTSVSTKTLQTFSNQLGNFSYRQIKEKLFTGYLKITYGLSEIAIASKAKALFDYLYLKTNLGDDLRNELEYGLRINWDMFQKSDLTEFESYVLLAESKKMDKILKNIKKILTGGLYS